MTRTDANCHATTGSTFIARRLRVMWLPPVTNWLVDVASARGRWPDADISFAGEYSLGEPFES